MCRIHGHLCVSIIPINYIKTKHILQALTSSAPYLSAPGCPQCLPFPGCPGDGCPCYRKNVLVYPPRYPKNSYRARGCPKCNELCPQRPDCGEPTECNETEAAKYI